MGKRYGKTRVSKIRAAFDDLRTSIRLGDFLAAEKALDRYEPWADYVFQAGPRIEELESEIERYRGELRKIVNGQGKMIWDEDREARAALRETGQ